MKYANILIAGLLLLAGCALPPQLAKEGEAKLILTPAIQSRRSIQSSAVPPGYVAGDIDHYLVKVFKASDHSEVMSLSGHGNPGVLDLVFGHLHVNTNYDLFAYAYDASNNPISVDASSAAHVEIGSEDRPTLTILPFLLKDKLFLGQGHDPAGNVALTEANLIRLVQ